MAVINTNIASMKAANASTAADKMLGTAMERLSTGKRINSAKDDAAGLGIATSMTASVRGMNQAIRNANDGISLAQTAEGALNEVTNLMQRMRELSVQASSGTYQEKDRTNMQAEVTELQKQVVDIMKTEFNGVDLFTADADNSVQIQVGAESDDQLTLNISALDLTAVSGTETDGEDAVAGELTTIAAGDARIGNHTITQEDIDNSSVFADTTNAGRDVGDTVVIAVGDQVWTPGTPATGPGVTGGISVIDAETAQAAIATIDTALDAVATTRASLGAGQSRLESVVNNLTTNATNLSDARSRIEDADYSAETTALAKAQILSQASTAMLSQANQSQQNVLSLLR